MRFWLILPLLLTSCELLDLQIPEPRNCSTAGSTADLSGEWVIKGVGDRKGCDDSIWDGSFELGPSRALRVESTPTAGTMRDLALGDSISGFQLNGHTEGSCVDFTTSEAVEGGTVSYAFQGGAASTSNVAGTFTSTHPLGCIVEGTFEVTIQP
ncbi:MAG: hypothetical protein JRH20_00840 [Deltaproteobacteria bacterium]|nr:hypothetical protein [Deltaproteobacteria bacterium]